MDSCAAAITHDNKRHATSSQFAALAVKSGSVIGYRTPRRRARGCLKPLHLIDWVVQGNPAVHLNLNP